jgi:D-alanyl-D-alanine dipeptidase
MDLDSSRFWLDSLTVAATYVDAVTAHPVHECNEPLVSIPEAAQAASVSILCPQAPHPPAAGVGRPRDHRLRRGNVQPLLNAATDFDRQGMTLVVEDALRSIEWQRRAAASNRIIEGFAEMLVQTNSTMSDHEIARSLTCIVAPTPKTAGHMAGAAVDVSIRLADGSELDRGGRYPDLSERMPMDSPFLSSKQREARELVSSIMAGHGFSAYPYEFWHYSRGDAHAAVATQSPEPAQYGPVNANVDGTVSQVPDPLERLNDAQRLVELVRAAEARRRVPS